MEMIYPLTPTLLSPKDLQEVEVFGREGKTHGDLHPGRRAEFLLRTLPWANVCCAFRALEGSSGVLPLLISKTMIQISLRFSVIMLGLMVGVCSVQGAAS